MPPNRRARKRAHGSPSCPGSRVASTNERIAELAHELWCESMTAQGWTHGPAYDPVARTHDAIAPFAQLSPGDRRQLLIAVESEAIARTLIELVRHDRGPTRPFVLEEICPGIEVTIDEQVPAGEGPRTGRIESWETDAAGEYLTLVRVRWSDGGFSEHVPEARELRRVNEA